MSNQSGAAARGPIARARASLRALEVMDRLTAGGGVPSASDLDEPRGWAGWGPMAPAFSPRRKDAWQQIGERLEWLLPPGQLREAEQATRTRSTPRPAWPLLASWM